MAGPDVSIAPPPAAGEGLPDEGLRARKKRATRRALRLAALRLVAERGFDRVTHEDIAAHADVSPRTFFNYFAGKEEALVGDDPELGPALAGAVRARPAEEAPLDALAAVVLEHAATVRLDEDFWRLRAQVLEANPTLVAALAGQSAALEQHLAEAVASRTGLDAAVSAYPRLVANVAVAVSRTAFQHAGAGASGVTFAEAVARAFDALRAGFPPPPRDD